MPKTLECVYCGDEKPDQPVVIANECSEIHPYDIVCHTCIMEALRNYWEKLNTDECYD